MAHIQIEIPDRHICNAIMSALGIRNQALQQGFREDSIILVFNGRNISTEGDRDTILDRYWATVNTNQPKPKWDDYLTQR